MLIKIERFFILNDIVYFRCDRYFESRVLQGIKDFSLVFQCHLHIDLVLTYKIKLE
jgi:hypothetical protein